MTGLEAISAHNGWAIAILGISIVFTGLTLLSITIAQLHKVLDLWDRRSGYGQWFKRGSRASLETGGPTPLPADIADAARVYKLLIEHMGDYPFSLPWILDLAVHRNVARPYSALNDLLLAGIIVPSGDGYYLWNEAVSGMPLSLRKRVKGEGRV